MSDLEKAEETIVRLRKVRVRVVEGLKLAGKYEKQNSILRGCLSYISKSNEPSEKLREYALKALDQADD